MKEICLNNLPRYINGTYKGKINWKECINLYINFHYEKVHSIFKIVNYISKLNELTLEYNNKQFKIKTGDFLQCKIGRIIGEITSEFKVEIGQTFKDNKRDITIIDRKIIKNKNGQSMKYYKYICNLCNYNGGKYYHIKDKIYKDEHWILESNLLNQENGCACCCSSPRIIVKGINDIATTHPHLVRYFANIKDCYKYTYSSNKKTMMICPDCKEQAEYMINKLSARGFSCKKCGDGISYSEKFIFNVLSQLKLDFQTQLSRSTFKWCQNYRYDFYFNLNGEQYIYEVNGLQHYEENTNFKMSLEEVQTNDKSKKELAIKNGIKKENYIVIDCRKSELEWIRDNKNGILSSKLNKLLDLNRIDWLKCEEFALSNRVKEACDLWNNKKENQTTNDISYIMKHNRATIIRWLKQGAKLGWCDYNAKVEHMKNSSKSKNIEKPIEIFKDEISLGIFKSATELEKQSERLFCVKLLQSGISSVCSGVLSHYKKYTFKFT